MDYQEGRELPNLKVLVSSFLLVAKDHMTPMD
jgi:hypothetical protein